MQVLWAVPFFAGLSQQQLEGIDRRMVSLSWAAGDPLFTAGGPADHLYVLAAGQAKLAQPTPSGQEVVVDLVPKTQAAVSAYAEGCDAEVGDEIRRLLFTAYWVDGMDIGNPELLFALLGGSIMRGKATSEPIREWGFAVTVTEGPITTRARRLTRGWNQEWQALGRPVLPNLSDGARVQSGKRALMQFADEVNQVPEGASDAGASRAGFSSGWRPPTTVRPPTTWVSQVGDPWARTLRMSR